MGVEKHFLWLIIGLIEFILLFSAYTSLQTEGIAQANVSGNETNQTGSGSAMKSRLITAKPNRRM